MDDILMDDLYTNKPKTTLVNSNENLVDGDIDSALSDLTRSDEDLKFIDAFDAIAKKNSEDKIRMMKKIKTNYKLSKESLSYSIESYCDSEIQSLEGAGEKIKERFITIFKKIAEFVKHLIDVITNMKYRGKMADDIKYCLKEIYNQTTDNIKKLSNTSEISEDDRKLLELKRKRLDSGRNACLHLLQCYGIAYKYAKKSGKFENIKSMSDVIDTDIINKIVPELKKVNVEFHLIAGLAKRVNDGDNRMTNIKNVLGEFNSDVKNLGEYDEKILKCKEDLQKKLDEVTNKK